MILRRGSITSESISFSSLVGIGSRIQVVDLDGLTSLLNSSSPIAANLPENEFFLRETTRSSEAHPDLWNCQPDLMKVRIYGTNVISRGIYTAKTVFACMARDFRVHMIHTFLRIRTNSPPPSPLNLTQGFLVRVFGTRNDTRVIDTHLHETVLELHTPTSHY